MQTVHEMSPPTAVSAASMGVTEDVEESLEQQSAHSCERSATLTQMWKHPL